MVVLDATNDKNNKNNFARAQEEENNNKMKENYDAYSRTYDDLDGNKRVVETLGIDQLRTKMFLSLIHSAETTRRTPNAEAGYCRKKKTWDSERER